LPEELAPPAGAFVSLKKGGELRGCIGTVEPVRRSLAEEIIANAVSAGVKDPRFSPVRLEEIAELTVSVDVLLPPERIAGPAELNPEKYGVIVRSGYRSGLLLPALEGIETADEQIAIARRKAGIGPREPVELYRFEVRRYE
ncbi:MAG: AmmeMemoRadiSam system protein A, partial [Firmicutes bacterium]|nr:AmmeMemoRadiSam system protein A [Bacillota bacterium]